MSFDGGFSRLQAGLLRRGLWRGAWRALVWAFWIVYFSFIVLVLALRYAILPNIEHYRPTLERLASRALGQTVSIGRVEARWEGLNPDLMLAEVRVVDAMQRTVLAFSRVEAVLSWWSVPSAQLKLRLLRIDEPTLQLRRDATGRLLIAGLPLLAEGAEQGSAGDWILAQRRIRIHGATLSWEDELRQAPPLILKNLDFGLDNDGGEHRFGLTALPPAEFASRLDLRGELKSRGFAELSRWSGRLYAEIDYADLAIWRQWIDYPLVLPRGRGALRAWIGLSERASGALAPLNSLTADVALREVTLRLARDLPTLDVDELSGRIGVRIDENGGQARGRALALTARPAGAIAETVRVAPSDFVVDWRHGEPPGHWSGKASAERLEVGALAQLSAYLPFERSVREALEHYAPQGGLEKLSAQWTGEGDSLKSFSAKTAFQALAVKAHGAFPGVSGLSGGVEASEKGGKIIIDAKRAVLDFPAVFPVVSQTALDTLKAEAKWSLDRGALAVDLAKLEFAGPDAAGSAHGVYRRDGEGPGSIDLSAALTRADARAVWRYMPRAVGRGAREWLRDSLIAGRASEAKLTLRGDLADFPFADPRRGLFLVTVKAHEAILDYAKGWPRIEGISGDLRFEGPGMVVEAERGTMLGASLGKTRAEIADFEPPVPLLTVNGNAEGPTSEFLKFIEQSPVAERIERFTEGMRAAGRGRLDLKLSIPLSEAQLPQSKVNGVFKLIDNEVTVDSALPPIRKANGSIAFTDAQLQVPGVTGTLFGGPLRVSGGTQVDGRVLIVADGKIDVDQLRQAGAPAWLSSLSGSSAYRGEVRVNKRNADLLVESSLVGLASALPAPLGKTAAEALPARFEKRLLSPAEAARNGGAADGAVRERINASLGERLSLQLVRRKSAEGFIVERGALASGRPPVLPDQGLAVGLTTCRLDIDAWRKALRLYGGEAGNAADTANAAEKSAAPFGTLRSVALKADEVTLFGRRFNEVDAQVGVTPTQYRVRLNSRQAVGELVWEGAGKGNLIANLRRLAIEPAESEAAAPAAATAASAESLSSLPGLDVLAEDFLLGARRLGRLELQARNEGGLWRLNRVQATGAHGVLSGSGQWRSAGARQRTQLNFKIVSDDLGKLLDRLGYPETVRAGTVDFNGRVAWDGGPLSLDYPSLNGDLDLTAAKGQFLKIDPGAGKLLGLLSLQSLPRRISFDFHDIFSEGFAFDTLAGQFQVNHGIMRSERLQLDGPSARVLMRGEVDLKRETQRVTINVQPELGGTAALGVALINPVAGAATWVAHKLLRNPLNQMFGFDYLVTGTWSDPHVEKLSGGEASQPSPPPRLPNASETPGENHEPRQ